MCSQVATLAKMVLIEDCARLSARNCVLPQGERHSHIMLYHNIQYHTMITYHITYHQVLSRNWVERRTYFGAKQLSTPSPKQTKFEACSSTAQRAGAEIEKHWTWKRCLFHSYWQLISLVTRMTHFTFWHSEVGDWGITGEVTYGFGAAEANHSCLIQQREGW